MELFSLTQGTSPLLISIPHAGTYVPDALLARMTEHASQLPDTDWHVPLLYDFAQGMNATIITAHYSRYVVDLNRPADSVSLYPGRFETGVCPTRTFFGATIYQAHQEPNEAEEKERIRQFWRPYHASLQQEIDRLKRCHGYALVWDAHSIYGAIPTLFDGRLPDLNFGTNNGLSCSTQILDRVCDVAANHRNYSLAVNGRFKGGYITRRYGDPANQVHAIQLELSQSTYLNGPQGADIHYPNMNALKDLLAAALAEFVAAGAYYEEKARTC